MPALKDTEQGRSTAARLLPAARPKVTEPLGRRNQMQLMLKQGCRGKNKQRLDTDPLAKPRDSQCCPGPVSHKVSCTPSKRGKFCYRNSGLGLSQKDRQIYQGW